MRDWPGRRKNRVRAVRSRATPLSGEKIAQKGAFAPRVPVSYKDMFISQTEDVAPRAPEGAAPGDGGREVDAAVAALAAAGEPTRLRALALLAEGELAVGELAQVLGQSQPRISRHLRLLTEAGMVERAPEGAWVFYRLPAPGTLERRLAESALAMLDRADAVLARDRAQLRDVQAAREEAAAAYFARNAADWDRVRA